MRQHTKKNLITSALLLSLFITGSILLVDSGLILGPTKVFAKKKQKTFKLNFNDVEISDFLKTMSGIIGKNIIADTQVRGKLTVISAKEIPIDQAYLITKSILQARGFAVIETPNLIKVVPIAEAAFEPSEIIFDDVTKINSNDSKSITYIYNVKHSDATSIKNVLNSMRSKTTKIILYPELNYVIISGMASEVSALIQIAKTLDTEIDDSEMATEDERSHGNIHIIHLQNADAEELANVLSRIPFSETAKINTAPAPGKDGTVRTSKKASSTTKTPTPTQSQSKLSIIANADTNSLIITATAEEYNQIKAIVQELDIVREQVLIEALIVEVSLDNSWAFGVNWMGGYGNDGMGGAVGSSLISDTDKYSNYSSPLDDKSLVLPINTGFQVGYLSDSSELGLILLNASATDSNFNILSTPQILTIDNQEAEINVGEEFPVPSDITSDDDGDISYSFDYKNAGLKLKITPHITKGGKITLDLYQEVNETKETTIADTVTSYVPKTVTTRDLKTRISILDGKTIVVGGLIQNKKEESVIKVPILGDIPVLGWLFKSKDVTYEKTNLMVFITPKIVTNISKLEKITQQKIEEQKVLQK